MSIRKSSSKSIISDISARLQKLEVDRAIGASNYGNNYDPELAEIQARYARYKEEKAEKWKRLGREPTYHESWAELTWSQYLYCAKGRYYTKEGRIIEDGDEAIAEFERGKLSLFPSCQLSIRLNSGCDQCSKNRDRDSCVLEDD